MEALSYQASVFPQEKFWPRPRQGSGISLKNRTRLRINAALQWRSRIYSCCSKISFGSRAGEDSSWLLKSSQKSQVETDVVQSKPDLAGREVDEGLHLQAGNGGFGGNDNGKHGGGGGGGGGGGAGDGSGDHHGEGHDDDLKNFGPVLTAEEVFREADARGVVLPSDMIEAAKVHGLRELLLQRYLDFQASGWPLGAAIRGCSLLRNRMLADPSFLFKVFTEIAIDSCCATFAEVQKRGTDFWNEFDLFLADMLVGIAVDIALVGMLAPVIQFGQPRQNSGFRGRIRNVIDALPSSVFEAETPGRNFSLQQRIGTYFYKGTEYAAVGFVCGIIGQGIANSIMLLKRKFNKSDEHDVPVPPLVKSAALWGFFLAVSSNTRYQIVNGLERVVESSTIAKKVPVLALAFTVGVRFANNVYGGMQFVDWARLTGVQ